MFYHRYMIGGENLALKTLKETMNLKDAINLRDSLKIPCFLFFGKYRSLSNKERLIYALLYHVMEKEGFYNIAILTVGEIAYSLCISYNTVQKSLRTLERYELIEIEKYTNGFERYNCFHLTNEIDFEEIETQEKILKTLKF